MVNYVFDNLDTYDMWQLNQYRWVWKRIKNGGYANDNGGGGTRRLEDDLDRNSAYGQDYRDSWYMDPAQMTWEQITTNMMMDAGCDPNMGMENCPTVAEKWVNRRADKTELKIEDLDPVQEYVFRIRATEDDISFGPGAMAIFKTYLTRTEILNKDGDQTSMTIEWAAVTNAVDYTVEYGAYDPQAQEQVYTYSSPVLYQGELLYTTEEVLLPSTQYVFHVVARDKHGHKSVEVSNAIDGYTQPELTTVEQTASDVNNVHIRFGDDPATMGQDVKVRGEFMDATFETRHAFPATSEQEVEVPDLHSCSSYNVYV